MASGGAMAGVSLWDATARQHAELCPDEQRAGFMLLGELAHGEPVTIAHFAHVLGIPTAKAEILVKDSTLRRFINLDETDRIVGFIGLSLLSTHHLFVVNGRKLWMWCAQDALFLPELLCATAKIESTDPETGQTVRLTVSADRVEAVETDGIVVSLIQPGTMDQSSAARIMATACRHIFFFRSRASGENWQTKHSEPKQFFCRSVRLLPLPSATMLVCSEPNSLNAKGKLRRKRASRLGVNAIEARVRSPCSCF